MQAEQVPGTKMVHVEDVSEVVSPGATEDGGHLMPFREVVSVGGECHGVFVDVGFAWPGK